MRAAVCLLLLFACGKPGGPCSPATCNGCCDSTGACVTGDEQLACGANGTACDVCNMAYSCQAHACVGRCNAQTCTGCCNEFGDCEFGNEYRACGLGGTGCADCSKLGWLCVNGVCDGIGSAGGGGTSGGAGDGGSAGGAGGGSGGGGGGTAGGDGGVPTTMRVFTTSLSVAPDFGGVQLGDRICNLAAADAGLAGRHVAWLSTPDAGPLARFPPGLNAQWRLGSTVAFSSRAQLAMAPSVPIDRDERGAVVAGSAWTGTSNTATSTGATCANWSSISAAGTYGLVNATTAWSFTAAPTPCTSARRLYCFQVQ